LLRQPYLTYWPARLRKLADPDPRFQVKTQNLEIVFK
jgi:hypothetical protein